LRLLYSFVTYLDKVIPVLLSAEQGSGKNVSDVLARTPYQNLKQLLNEEKMQEAQELASMLQQDLLSMVLEDGYYPPGVVRYLTKDFPIVGITSVLVSQVKCEENLVTVPGACQVLFEKRVKDDADAADQAVKATLLGHGRPVVRRDNWKEAQASAYFVNPDGLGEVDSLSMIQAMLEAEEVDVDGVCDLSFNVSCQSFARLLFRIASNRNIKSIGKVIERCAIDSTSYDSLILLCRLDSVGIPPFPLSDCLAEILRQKKFDDAALFLEFFEAENDFFPVLLEAMRNSSDKADIYRLSERSKDRLLRELGLSEIELGGVVLEAIPPAWRQYGKPPDEALSHHFEDGLEKVVTILKQFDQVDCDDRFIAYLNGISDGPVRHFVHKVAQFLPVCRQPGKLAAAVTVIFEARICAMKVTDPDSEDVVLNVLIEIHSLLRRFEPRSFTQKVSVLRSIVARSPQRIHNISYEFADSPLELFALCGRLDLLADMQNMIGLWDLDPHEVNRIRDRWAFTAFTFSNIDAVPSDWELSPDFFGQLIPLFDRPTFVDPAFISPFLETFPPTDSMLYCHWKIGHEPSATPLRAFFLDHAPVEVVINYLASSCDFRQAIDVLMGLPDAGTRRRVFRKQILEVAISNDQVLVLKDAMGTNDELFQALEPCGNYLQLHIAEYRKRYHDVCAIALKLYRNNVKSPHASYFLRLAEEAIDNIEDPTEDERQQKLGIGFQKKYIETPSAWNLAKLNILDSGPHRISAVLVLFSVDEFEFACTVINTFQVDARYLGGRIETLSWPEPNKTVEFVKRFQAAMTDVAIFKDVLYGMVMTLVYLRKQLNWVVYEILPALKDPEFKCKLLIQFGFLEEALPEAQRACPRLVPLIGNLALMQDNTKLVERCMKWLESAMKR
jgi:hypothetical protein